MYQRRCAAKNSWWWAERLPETCRVVIPIKLEFSASVGFIHKELVTLFCFVPKPNFKIWNKTVSLCHLETRISPWRHLRECTSKTLRYTGLQRTHADPAEGPEPTEYQFFCVVSIRLAFFWQEAVLCTLGMRYRRKFGIDVWLSTLLLRISPF